jgi:spore coat-associated protein N
MRFSLSSTTGKVLASTVLLGAAVSVAGLGTFGTFTSATAATAQVSSGKVAIALGSDGTATNRLTVAANKLVPGDTVQRAVQLSNAAGQQDLSSITLTTTAPTSSLLDTDATNGLQLVVDVCSQPWTEVGTAPAYTYSCPGVTKSVLTSRPVKGANMALANLTSTTAGNTDNLRVTLSFPTVANDTFQNLDSSILFTFNGTQRAATSS